MKRHAIERRADWAASVESVGMYYHTMDGEIYWDESACYEFTADEIDRLEAATEDLHKKCLETVEQVIEDDRFDELRIPEAYRALVTRSWEHRESSMYGRFDFCFDGSGEPKMLEYNADTPTSLLEASVVQWYWLKDCRPDADQFNSIHERLIDFWKENAFGKRLHVACLHDTEEDFGNVEYVRDVATQAGYETRHIFIEDIGWDAARGCFVDMKNDPIETLFKLYPWEWMFTDEYGDHLSLARWNVLEPPWKAILSNKGILALLWERYPDHPNLLPAYFDQRFKTDFVRKPLFSREGDSVLVNDGGRVTEKPGTYGAEGYVFQAFSRMPEFSGNFVSVGSWIVNDEPAGMGIREDATMITSNTSRFIPHFFK